MFSRAGGHTVLAGENSERADETAAPPVSACAENPLAGFTPAG